MDFTSVQGKTNEAYFAGHPFPVTQSETRAADYAVPPQPVLLPGADVAHYVVQPASGIVLQAVDVPPGLELLLGVDEFHVHEHTKCLQIFPNARTTGRYSIFSKNGHLCYVVGPPDECLCCRARKCECKCECRQKCRCCDKVRDYNMYVRDINREHLILNAYRESPCCAPSCVVDAALKVMHVEAPVGIRIGSIKFHDPCCGTKKFLVQNVAGETQLVMVRPCCEVKLCNNSNTMLKLEIRTANESACVGSIKRKYPGCCKNACFRASEYLINFPADLDVKVKAVLMIVPYFIDLLVYRKWIVERLF